MESPVDYCRITSAWKTSDIIKNYVRYQLEESDEELIADFGSLPEECITFVNSTAFTTPGHTDSSDNEPTAHVNEENPLNSCSVDIEMSVVTHSLLAIDILCTARYMEVYGSSGMYIETVKGTSVETTSDGQDIYLLQHSFETALARCKVKLCRIQRSDQLLVRCFLLTLGKVPPPSLTSLLPGVLPGAHLDMAKVRSLISDSGKQVSPQAQQLMNSLEHIQQASSGGGQFGSGSGATMAMLSALMSGLGKMPSNPAVPSFAPPTPGVDSRVQASNVSAKPPADISSTASNNCSDRLRMEDSKAELSEGTERLQIANDRLLNDTANSATCSLPTSAVSLRHTTQPVTLQDLDMFEQRLYQNVERQLAAFEQRLISKLDSMAMSMAAALMHK